MPQPFKTAVLTDGGANLLVRAQTEEIRIEFTKIIIGSGDYDDGEKTKDYLKSRMSLKEPQNSYPLSNMEIVSDTRIKLSALISNKDLTTGETLISEGYYINEIGLYAKASDDAGDEDILYSIAVTAGEIGDFMPAYDNGYDLAQIIQDFFVTVDTCENVSIYTSNTGAVVLMEDFLKHTGDATAHITDGERKKWNTVGDKADMKTLKEHMDEKNNPHAVTGEQLGIATGICSSVHGATAKAVDCPGFELQDGARIMVTFSNGNTSNYFTMNVNDTGAYAVWFPVGSSRAYNNEQISKYIVAGCAYEFIFQDGENPKWVYCGITNATAASKLETARSICGQPFDGSEDIGFGLFGCNTDADVEEKIVTTGTDFELKRGAEVYVIFWKGNTRPVIKLNVNGTGAAYVVHHYATNAMAGRIAPRTVHKFIYDGYWYCVGGDAASRWADTCSINGMLVDGTENRYNYGVCTTSADTAGKAVECEGFSLATGAEITVKFTNGDTAGNPTLDINGTGAKPIYYRGAAIAAGGLAENGTYSFRYNGAQWDLVAGAFGDFASKAIYGDATVSMGRKADTAIGEKSFAFGGDVTASGSYSNAEGNNTTASGFGSHAEGRLTNASEYCSHTEGDTTEASGISAHAEGGLTTASGHYSHAAGYCTTASGWASCAIGTYNKVTGESPTLLNDLFMVGNGHAENGEIFLSNALRVTHHGDILGTKAFQSSGADYAEYIKPWADGNPDNEDRVGYFVTVKAGLLQKAGPGDYIAGITSGNPSVIGNADEDYYWRYERDEFNRIAMEDVPEMVQEADEGGNLVFDEETHKPAMVETGNVIKNARMKLAEGYDPSLQKTYIPRKDRKEWDCVGMTGVIPVRDDGTCLPDHFCRCGQGGIATLAEGRGFDTFYVIERISENVVSVELR